MSAHTAQFERLKEEIPDLTWEEYEAACDEALRHEMILAIRACKRRECKEKANGGLYPEGRRK